MYVRPIYLCFLLLVGMTNFVSAQDIPPAVRPDQTEKTPERPTPTPDNERAEKSPAVKPAVVPAAKKPAAPQSTAPANSQDKPATKTAPDASKKPAAVQPKYTGQLAKGVVYVDLDGDGKFGESDAPFSGAKVSNGIDIVKTDKKGRYELPIQDDFVIFVIKPNDFQVPLNRQKLPQFYYIHKPQGSPQLKYPGSKATGALPQSIDFPLYQQTEAEQFKILLFGDPQPRDDKEVDYIAQDVVKDLIGSKDKAFGVTLGDIAFDNLETFKTLNQTISMIGIPWYNVIGNHDLNLDAKTRKHINETFEATYGPSYYSFDYGQVHFVVLDNIDWAEPTERIPRMHYDANFGKQQLAFLEKDLAMIPETQMVVLLMHVPIIGTKDKADFFKLIEKRPYCVSVSGHTHDHRHLFLKKEDGFNGKKPHHHIVNVTVSGSWWSGTPNENGIPHTTMKDGAPNGYSIMSFDESGYKLDFRAADRPADEQLRIDVPMNVDTNRTAKTKVWVNVFNGSEKSTVRMSVDNQTDWIELKKKTAVDPYYRRIYQRDAKTETPISKPKPSTHLWQGKLPELDPGAHLLIVETTDRHGRKYMSQRSIRVTGEKKLPEKSSNTLQNQPGKK